MTRGSILTFVVAFALFLIDGSALLDVIETLEDRIGKFGPDSSTDAGAAPGTTPGAAPETADEREARPQPAGPVYAWSQVAPGGALMVRAVVPPGTACPSVRIGDGRRPMVERPPRNPTQFPVTLCEQRLDPLAVTALAGVTLADDSRTALPLQPLKTTVKSAIVLGDTGCRLAHYEQQDCNYQLAWPFASIARLAAAKQPDLIVHLGDYHYREKPCPEGQDGCAGSPWGDRWEVWRQDFFEPAKSLLGAAPWIAVRGNHENCERAGDGWMHFLSLREPGAKAKGCRTILPPYRLSFPGLSLMVLDIADLIETLYLDRDKAVFAELCRSLGAFKRDIEQRDGRDRLNLLVFHQPVYTYNEKTRTSGFPVGAAGNDSLAFDPVIRASRAFCANAVAEAGGGGEDLGKKKLKLVPDTSIQAVLKALAERGKLVAAVSGDTHNFQSISFEPGDRNGGAMVHQIILGNGGTLGETTDLNAKARGERLPQRGQYDCLKRTPDDPDACNRANFAWGGQMRSVAHAFGYMHLELVEGAGWKATVRDLRDRAIAVCGFPFHPVETTREAIVSALAEGKVSPAAMKAVAFDGEGCRTLPD